MNESDKAHGTTHVFSVPQPFPGLPAAIAIKKGEQIEKFIELVSSILKDEKFNKGGFSDKEGKLTDDLQVKLTFHKESPINYPKEFAENLEPHEQETIKEFFNELRKGKEFPIISGVYGDVVNCDAVVEKVVDLPTGGRAVKPWGCTYLFKGFPQKEITEGMGTVKALLSQLPRNLITTSWYWMAVLFIRALLFRKQLIHDLRIWFSTPYWHTVGKMPAVNYTAVPKELKRAGDITLQRMLDRRMNKRDYPPSQVYGNLLLNRTPHHSNKREIWEFLAHLLEFAYFFIEYDNAYRFRLQDLLPLVNKDNLRKNTVKEVLRILDILVEREHPELSNTQRNKWKAIKVLLVPMLYLIKDIREFVREYVLEIDMEKIKPDEDDLYFTLRRKTYKFRDVPYEERVAEADRIDREKKHTRFHLVAINDLKTGAKIPSVRVIQPA